MSNIFLKITLVENMDALDHLWDMGPATNNQWVQIRIQKKKNSDDVSSEIWRPTGLIPDTMK
jgi:hypothetical protein